MTKGPPKMAYQAAEALFHAMDGASPKVRFVLIVGVEGEGDGNEFIVTSNMATHQISILLATALREQPNDA